MPIFAVPKQNGAIAQLVEQRTENPCVPGSIPGSTTFKIANNLIYRLLAIFNLNLPSCPRSCCEMSARTVMRYN